MTLSRAANGAYMYGSHTLNPGSTYTESKTVIALQTSAGGAALVVKAPHTTASADLPGWMAAKPTSSGSKGVTLAAESTSGFATVTSALDAAAAKASESVWAHLYEPGGSGAAEIGALTRWGVAVFGVIFGAFVLL